MLIDILKLKDFWDWFKVSSDRVIEEEKESNESSKNSTLRQISIEE